MKMARLAAKSVELAKKRKFALLSTMILRTLFPVGNPLLHFGHFYLCRLQKLRDIPIKLTVEAGVAGEKELDEVAKKFPSQARHIMARRAAGQQCIVARHGEKIVGHVWSVHGQEEFTNSRGWVFKPPAREGTWCHNSWVDPAYRMRGAFLALMRALARQAGEAAQLPLYGCIDYWNETSLRAHKSCGWEFIREVRFVSLLGFKVFRVSGPDERPTTDLAYALRVPQRHLM